MPRWHNPPSHDLKNTLHEFVNQLDEEVASDPTFEEMVGIKPDELTAHAMEAITVFLAQGQVSAKGQDPGVLLEIYTLGFVIGVKFGEKRARSDEQTT
jgi:hypothetical protein